MSPEQPEETKGEARAKKVRLLCWGCNRWTEVAADGPKHVFVGHLLPDSPGARVAGEASAGFMYRHLSRCKRPVVAIYESDPRWPTLEETNREDDDRAY